MYTNDSKNFELNLSNYSGPLDVLLDLAKSQKVNLAEISIAELADQFAQMFFLRPLKLSR